VLRSSYAVARARHTVARQEAYDGARDDAIAERVCGPELRITDIDAHALATRERTWSGVHPSGAGGWNWPGLVERLPSRAAVLPIAIWYGNDLCGLALGQASRHRADGCRHTVTLTYVERRPEPHRCSFAGRFSIWRSRRPGSTALPLVRGACACAIRTVTCCGTTRRSVSRLFGRAATLYILNRRYDDGDDAYGS
jgi:hypothetical protein